MLILLHETDINQLPDTTPPEVMTVISSILKSLDENYGADRTISDDGGYIAYSTDEKDFSLKDDTKIAIGMSEPEYVEIIKTSAGDYLNALLLTNNEYGITFIVTKEIAPELLLAEL